MQRKSVLAALSGLLVAGALGAGAQPGASAGGQQQGTAYEVKSGVWAFRDAQTGALLRGPVAQAHLEALRSEISELANVSSAGLVSETNAQGVTSLPLQGRFQNVVVLNIGTDGSRKTTCTQDPDEVLAALRVRTVPLVNGLETE
jgi:hypothetical protein